MKSIVVNHKDDINTFEFQVVEKAADPKTYELGPKSVPNFKVIEVKQQ